MTGVKLGDRLLHRGMHRCVSAGSDWVKSRAERARVRHRARRRARRARAACRREVRLAAGDRNRKSREVSVRRRRVQPDRRRQSGRTAVGHATRAARRDAASRHFAPSLRAAGSSSSNGRARRPRRTARFVGVGTRRSTLQIVGRRASRRSRPKASARPDCWRSVTACPSSKAYVSGDTSRITLIFPSNSRRTVRQGICLNTGRHIPKWRLHRRTPQWTCTRSARSPRPPVSRSARVEALVASGRVRSLAVSPGYFAADQAIAAVRALRADGGRSAAMLFDKPEFAHASARMPDCRCERRARGHCRHAHSDQHDRAAAGGGNTRAHRARDDEARLHCVAGSWRRWRRWRSYARKLRHLARNARANRRSTARCRFGKRRSRSRPRPNRSRLLLRLPWNRSRFRQSSRRSQRSPPTRSNALASSTSLRRSQARAADLESAAAWAQAPARVSAKATDPASVTDPAAGMGGGPYRPGSGVMPPRLLREVKAGYTEDARRANIEGEVVLEIVVRRDGSVSDVKLVNGLPRGLNERAIAAVRQWRFAPATRLGQAVDVIVEVAVEFKLR